MATATLKATYARSGSSAYTGQGSSSYLAIGKCTSNYSSSGFTTNAVYRGCIGFDLSSLSGATISSVKLCMQGADNQGATNDTWSIQLSSANTWNHSNLATVSVGAATALENRWFERTISGSGFIAQLAAIGGTAYFHIINSSGAFKLWEGSASAYSARPYLLVEYETSSQNEPKPEPQVESTIAVTAFSAERCTYNSETGSYVASSSGARVRVTIAASLRTDGSYSGNHIASAKLRFSAYGSSSATTVTVPWTSGTSYSTSNNLTLLASYTFSASTAYDLELVLQDQFSSVSAYTSLAKSFTIVHVAGNKKGVAIGGFSTATASQSKFECYFPAYFYGGIAQGLRSLADQGLDIVKGSVSGCGTTAKNVTFPRTLPGVPVVLVSQNSGNAAAAKITSISASGFTIQSAASSTGYNYIAIYWGNS